MSDSSQARTGSKAARRILHAVGLAPFVVLFLLANLYFLADHPLVEADEPWTSDAPRQFSQTGHFAPSMFRGLHYNLEGDFRWSLNDLWLASVFKVFGFGLYQARFASSVAGILALLILYLLGKHLYNARVGLLATILFAFSPGYQVARITRPEILLTVLTLTALYLCFWAVKSDRTALYGLSGLVGVLATNVHLNGLMVLAAGGMVLLTQTPSVHRKARAIGLYLLGVLFGGVCWVLVYGPMLTEFSGESSVFPPANYWAFTWLKVKSYGSWFYGGAFHYLSVISVLMLASMVALAIRRRPADRVLLIAIATFVPFYVFVFVNPHGLYLAYLFPLLYLMLSAWIDTLVDRVRKESAPVLGIRAIAAVALLTIVLGQAMARGVVEVRRASQQRQAGGYAGYIAKLKAYIPANAVIMGQPTWYYGFSEQPYYSDRYFAWISMSPYQEVRDRLGRSFEEAMAKTRVEYLIIDEQLHQRMLNRVGAPNALPREELAAFLREKCVEVGVVSHEYYGAMEGSPKLTRIYRVREPRRVAQSRHAALKPARTSL